MDEVKQDKPQATKGIFVIFFPILIIFLPDAGKTPWRGKNFYLGREKVLRGEVKMKVGYGGGIRFDTNRTLYVKIKDKQNKSN